MATETQIVITAVDKTAETFRSVGKGLGDLNKQLGGLLGPLTALTAVGGFAAFIKSAANAGDELNKLSQKTGATVEALSAYRYAASLANISNEQLGTGLSKLQKSMSEALIDPAGDAARTFRALGVAVDDGRGKLRSTDQVLGDLSAKFAAAADGPEKTAIAMRLLGRSGAELIPFLNSLKQSTDEAERMGLIVSTDFARKSEQFNDNIKRMESHLSHLAVVVAGPVVDAFNRLADAMLGQESLDALMRQRAVLAQQFTAVANSQSYAMQELKKNILKEIDDLDEKIIAKNRALAAKTSPMLALNLPSPITSGGKDTGRGSSLEEEFRSQAEISAQHTAAGITLMAEEIVRTYQTAGEKIAELKQTQLDNDTSALMQSLMTETELIDQKYAADLQALYDARSAEYLTEVQFKDAREQLEQKHSANIGLIARNESRAVYDARANVVQQSIGLLQLYAGKSKAAALVMIALQKGLAIAETIMNTHVAAMRAMSQLGVYGYPVAAQIEAMGAIAVGLIGAQGLVEASMVASGGASSGSPANPISTISTSGTGVPALASDMATPAASGPTRIFNIHLSGEGAPSQAYIRDVLIPGFQEAFNDGVGGKTEFNVMQG